MRRVGWLAAMVALAAPAASVAGSGDYDPCKNRVTRRIAVVYTRSSAARGDAGECKGEVHPAKKTVCVGDTVYWSVVNACDAQPVSDIRVEGLDRVVESCSTVRQLGVGAVKEFRCRVRRDLREDVRQEYEVRGRIGRTPANIDPELEIRRPR